MCELEEFLVLWVYTEDEGAYKFSDIHEDFAPEYVSWVLARDFPDDIYFFVKEIRTITTDI